LTHFLFLPIPNKDLEQEQTKMTEEINKYMSIVGIKTKGGFPTIECKNFNDVDSVETEHKFYDKKIETYYAFKNGFFFSWCDGQMALDDFDLAKEHLHKALFPNDKMTLHEREQHSRKVAGLEPRPQTMKLEKHNGKVFQVTRNHRGKIICKVPRVVSE